MTVNSSTDADFILGEIAAQKDFQWAYKNFPRIIRELIRTYPTPRVLEIGGGRSPMFTREDVAEMGCAYTANDISQRELDRAPDYVSKARFDIATRNNSEIAPFAGSFDFIFSKFVFEHLPDAAQAYRNISVLLRPGGMCVNYHPVLFSPPFVANKILPQSLSSSLLQMFFKDRNDDQEPKFKAYYNLCRVGPSTVNTIAAAGFSKVKQQAFYNHRYFHKIPVLREIDRAFGNYASRNEIATFASFAYTIVTR